MTEEDNLVRSWHRFFNKKNPIDDKDVMESDQWAAVKIRRLLHDQLVTSSENNGVIDDPQQAWEIILKLIEASQSREALTAVAAGPLRQLMDAYFDDYIERVKEEAENNQGLSYALSYVFIHDKMHLEQLLQLGNRAAMLDFPNRDPTSEEVEMDLLVARWFCFYRGHSEIDSNLIACALDEVNYQLPNRDPHKSWLVILKLLAACTSKDEAKQIGYVISELLSVAYSEFIGKIKRAVRDDNRLACALTNTSVADEYSAEWSEVVALAIQISAGPWTDGRT
jgi:hypothetical protein